MKTFGVIAEYDPFHQGHAYLLEEARRELKADACVSVMSGDFTERGMPALENKWIRAEKAVKNGVDLVLELPAVFVLAGAGEFARAGVKILEGMGLVDAIAFGSESGDIEELEKAAELVKASDDGLAGELTRRLVRQGFTYPKARLEAMGEAFPDFDADVLLGPNNILGIEYMKNLTTMSAFTVKRQGGSHVETATMLRKQAREADPARFARMDKNYYDLLEYKLLNMNPEEADELYSAGGGLGSRAVRYARESGSLEALISNVKTKAYTRTRVQRLLAQAALGIDREQASGTGLYARVLAFNGRGAALLKEIKKKECASIPVITNVNRYRSLGDADPDVVKTLEIDRRAADFYNIITEEDLYNQSDYVKMPYMSA